VSEIASSVFGAAVLIHRGSADFREIFDPCVNRTLELIDGQIAAVQVKGLRVKVSLPSHLKTREDGTETLVMVNSMCS
jgi:hypothetical protein